MIFHLNLRSLFKSKTASRRKRATTLATQAQPLEIRTLLAGTVIAQITSDGSINLTGDGEKNVIAINVDVAGVTTIEG